MKKLIPGFKNHMRNLDNFRKAVESPKRSNSKGYICPRNTFLQLKHYIQRKYLTLLSTTMKIHRILYVIFETINHFSLHNLPVFFKLKHYILLTEISLKSAHFQISTARVKIRQNIHVILQQKVSFSSKFGSLLSIMRDNPSALF